MLAIRASALLNTTASGTVSRWRTFYGHFVSRQDCFIALLRDANAEIVRQIAAAVERALSGRSGARRSRM